MDNIFYVYVWYKNNIPVYVGKGKGRRAYRNKDVDVEIVRYNLTEQQAFDLEKALISEYGRADLNEGSLWNLTNGGGINFSTLYWDGSILKAKHLAGLKNRNVDTLRRNASIATATRSEDWQDSLYLVKKPDNTIVELKTQELKIFCKNNNLDFDQMKHIARTRPPTRKSSPHYGFDVKCIYNKVTGIRLDKEKVINTWNGVI